MKCCFFIGNDIQGNPPPDLPINSKHLRVTKQQMKDMIAWLIVNTFIRFGPIIAQQIIGIPMGTNPAVFFRKLLFILLRVSFYQETFRFSKNRSSKTICF